MKAIGLAVLAVLSFACAGYRDVGTSSVAVPTPTLTPRSEYALYPGDSGRTVVVRQANWFTVDLDPLRYPPGELRLRCSHDRVLRGIGGEDGTGVPRPYVFEAREPGDCRITSGGFEVTVRVVP